MQGRNFVKIPSMNILDIAKAVAPMAEIKVGVSLVKKFMNK